GISPSKRPTNHSRGAPGGSGATSAGAAGGSDFSGGGASFLQAVGARSASRRAARRTEGALIEFAIPRTVIGRTIARVSLKASPREGNRRGRCASRVQRGHGAGA